MSYISAKVTQNDSLQPSLDHDFDQFSFQNTDDSPKFPTNSSFNNISDSPHLPNAILPNPSKNIHIPNFENISNVKKDQPKKKVSTEVVVHIKVSDTTTKQIRCNLEDNVLELAKNFCQENNLAPQAVPVIINIIKQQFGVILQRMRENAKANNNSTSSDDRSTPRQRDGLDSDGNRTIEIKGVDHTGAKLIGKLDVAISPTESKELKLFQGQDPAEVAFQFCKENTLPLEIVEVLARKLEEMRRWYEKNKNKPQGNQQEKKEIEEDRGLSTPEQRNPFKLGGYQDRDGSPTGSPNFQQQGTAAFVTEESDISENEHKEERRRSKPKKEAEKEERSPEDFTFQEINKKLLIGLGKQFEQAKVLEKKVFEEAECCSPREREKKLTKNQAEDLLNRLYYNEKGKEAALEEVRAAYRVNKEYKEAKELTFQPNVRNVKKSPPRDQTKRSPPRDQKIMENREQKEKVIPVKEVKMKAEQASPRLPLKNIEIIKGIGNHVSRSRSPVHDKVFMEDLQSKNNENKGKPIGQFGRRQMSPDTSKNKLAKELIDKLAKVPHDKEETRHGKRNVEESKTKETKTVIKYFQPTVNRVISQKQEKNQDEKDSRQNPRSLTTENSSNKKQINSTSNQQTKHVNQKKKLKAIFEKLDSDKDGFISIHKIDLAQISKEVLDSLLSFVGLLETTYARLDYTGFVSALERLKLEDKVLRAIERTEAVQIMANPKEHTIQEYELENEKRSLDEHSEAASFVEHDGIRMNRSPSKRSDISTASSNQTENSARSIKSYKEFLEKKV